MLEDDRYLSEVNANIVSIYSPLIILTGVCFNFLCLLVWCKQINSAPVAVFLFALAILDTVALFCEPFPKWMHIWFKDRSRYNELENCWVFIFIQHFVTVCSGWIIFFICFVQACSLCIPDKTVITKEKAIFVILCISICSVATNYHFTNYEDIRTSQNINILPFSRCRDVSVVNKTTHSLFSFNWVWIDRLVGCLFPVTLTLACLIAIVQIQNFYAKCSQNSEPLIVTRVCCRQMSRFNKEFNKIAVIVGVTYMVSTVPIAVYRVTVEDIVTIKQELVNTILSALGHLFLAVRFLYYYKCSVAFRKSTVYLLRLLKSGKCCINYRNQVDAIGSFHAEEEVVRLEIAEISSDGSIHLEISGFGESTEIESQQNRLSVSF